MRRVGPRTEAHKKAVGDFFRGKKLTEEHKTKIGLAHKGRKNGPLKAETKQKLSVKFSGANNPMYGLAKEDYPNAGKIWATNGSESKMFHKDSLPLGWYPGRHSRKL